MRKGWGLESFEETCHDKNPLHPEKVMHLLTKLQNWRDDGWHLPPRWIWSGPQIYHFRKKIRINLKKGIQEGVLKKRDLGIDFWWSNNKYFVLYLLQNMSFWELWKIKKIDANRGFKNNQTRSLWGHRARCLKNPFFLSDQAVGFWFLVSGSRLNDLVRCFFMV